MKAKGYCRNCGEVQFEIHNMSISSSEVNIYGKCCKCGKKSCQTLTKKEWEVFKKRGELRFSNDQIPPA